jgi:simple sugar transport system permease protein
VFGTMVAVGIISLVSNSMLILGIDPYWQQFFNGLVILVGITVSALQAKRQKQ